MTMLINMKFSAVFILLALAVGFCLFYKKSAAQEKVSVFGKYEGYSRAMYDGARRTSDYLTLSNGTRLAYDLILPTRKGVPAGERLPVLFKYTPYLRTFTIFDEKGKNIIADLFDLPETISQHRRIFSDNDRIWRDSRIESGK